MGVKLDSGGTRVGLDDACGVSDLDRGGDPSVEANTRPRVARSGPDPRGDAVEELLCGRDERAERLNPTEQKSMRCCSAEYLDIFLSSAAAVAAPELTEVRCMYDWALV